MATEAGELVVKISADVADIKQSLQAMTGQVSSLGVGTVAAGNIMAAAFQRMGSEAVTFVRESVMAFAEHEQAMKQLTLLVGGPAAEAMRDFAGQIQATTSFSDDAVLALEKQLSQYGIYPASVKSATQALIDFAAVTGKDLPEAGSMLARAMTGQSRELKQYGLDLSATATRSQNLATTVQFLEKRFAGAAETMRGTTLGAIESLKNGVSDLQKQLGELLAPTVNVVIKELADLVAGVNASIRSGKTYADTIDAQRQKLADLTTQLRIQVSNHVEVTKAQKAELAAVVNHIGALKRVVAAKAEHVGATEREIAAVRALKDQLVGLELEQQHLSEVTALETQVRILQAQNSWQEQASFSDQLTVHLVENHAKVKSDWINIGDGMVRSFSDATARMIMEGGRFRDVISNLWRSIAEQVIAQIIRMIAEWLIWMAMTGGSGGGLAFAGGRMAAGGMINEPSMLIGMRTGSRHIVGEAGPEEVVPRGTSGKGNQANADSGAGGGGSGGGGGGITINISGQFVEGSPSKWQRMIQEQIVPQLRRFSMKQPVGVVTRKRGAMS